MGQYLNGRLTSGYIIERLSARYGVYEQVPRYDALDELIFTVLTQNTSDINAERAFDRLRSEIPGWRAVMEASEQAIASAIHHGGMANQKSVRLKAILRAIESDRGWLSIDFLRDWGLEEARGWLMALPGVGPKTAAVVMSFALGMPAFPVDTHIHRVALRLGLIPQKTTAEAAHALMESATPAGDRFQLHMQLITHGRQVCKARRPLCEDCPLNARCPSSTAS